MEYAAKQLTLKDGSLCVIRRAEASDAERVLRYQKETSSETPYLVVGPEDIGLTLEEQEQRIEQWNASAKRLRLLAEVDEELAGVAIVYGAGAQNRLRHRCCVDIALYQRFCGMGIGTLLLGEVLSAAGTAGYEQAELDVVSTNVRAIALYRKLGFGTVGTIPHALKFRDGSYVDFLLMTKSLL